MNVPQRSAMIGCWLPSAALGLAAVVASAVERIALPEPLPRVQHPRDNPPTAGKIALGKKLFFDKRLSRTGAVSCATCHDPHQGFSDGRRIAVGVEGRTGARNSPTLINVAYNRHMFWDGRVKSLEEQALEPIQNGREMDMPLKELIKRLTGDEGYRRQFREVFGGAVTARRVAQAIAAYERTIISRDTPFDRHVRGEQGVLSPAARRGMALFFGDARCSACHSGPHLSDGAFHNVGVIDANQPDAGRRGVTGNKLDEGAFKTPSLRGVALTAPYMHNGQFKTLTDVVQHYNFGGVTNEDNPHRDERLEVLYLDEDQVADLVAFLRDGLTEK